MAGATMKVTVDAAAVAEALNRATARARDMTPLMRDIGERLLHTTRERFVSHSAPTGEPWSPLSEDYKQTKKKNQHKILTYYGILRGQLNYRASRDQVEVGSPTIYAGTHQFGAQRGAFGTTSGGAPIPWGNIPARPFLGLSDEDEAEVVQLANDFMAG